MILNGISTASATLATSKGTDHDLFAGNVANVARMVIARQRAYEDNRMPDTSSGEALDENLESFGIEVPLGSPSVGSVTVSSSANVNIPAGSELLGRKNRKRYRLVTGGIFANGDLANVEAVDLGKDGNLDEGEELRWTNAITNLNASALVAEGGLTLGTDAPNEAKKRLLWIESFSVPKFNKNWAVQREYAKKASNSVYDAFCYPGVQGPSTFHIAYTIEGTKKNGYARAGGAVLTSKVATNIGLNNIEGIRFVTTTVAHLDVSLAFKIDVPNPKAEGGDGGGWIESTAERFPSALASAPPVISSISADQKTFTVNATTPTPVVGIKISFWDSSRLEVVTEKVTAVSGSSGAWVLTLENPAPTLTAGDYIFPALENAEGYAKTIMEWVAKLAPGEKTSEVLVLPRAYRRPRDKEGFKSKIDYNLTKEVESKHNELTQALFFAVNGTSSFTIPLTPSLPGTVTSPPKVYRILRLGFYPVLES